MELPVEQWERLHCVLGSERFEQFVDLFQQLLVHSPVCSGRLPDGREFQLTPDSDGRLQWVVTQVGQPLMHQPNENEPDQVRRNYLHQLAAKILSSG